MKRGRPDRSGATGQVETVPVPALVRPERSPRLSRSDLLYRVYLVVVFGGMYGYVLGRAVVLAEVPPMGEVELAATGVLAALLPVVATFVGVRFGRWAGPVPVGRPEASVLLPTLVDRRELLLPRLRRSYAVATAAGAVGGFAAVLLLALNADVGALAWVAVPSLCAIGGLLAAAVSAGAQSLPREGRRHQQVSVALLGLGTVVSLAAVDERGRRPFAQLAASVLGIGDADGLVGLLVVVTALALVLGSVGRAAIVRIHDEELTARAGLHAGLAASAKLGDLRAIALSREPTNRRRTLRTPPAPRRAAGAIAWRHLTALRANPAPVVRCAAGWVSATLVIVLAPSDAGIAATAFRVALAGGLLYAGVFPVLEPLRREHDSPLASELLPFGFATLAWLHLRAALTVVTAIGFVSVGATVAITGHGLRPWTILLVVPPVALTATVVVADRVRQPASLPEIIDNLPGGAMPEVLGLAMLVVFVQPVLAMLPAALPAALALSAPALGLPVGTAAALGAVPGGVLLALRGSGLWLWLDGYERALHEAELLEATSTIALAWHRLRTGRPRAGA